MKYAISTLLIAAMSCLTAYAQPGQTESEEAAPSTITVTPSTGTQTPVTAPQPQTPRLPAYMEEAKNMEQTSVEWYENLHDFGKIIEGDIAKYTFHFKNTGDHPLKLVRVKPSCGCTTPSYTQEEIAPGEEGYIEVAFNSAHKRGFQNKAVTVTGNFEGTNMILRFKGEVVPVEAPAVEGTEGS